MKHIIKAILIGIMLLILFSFKASAQKKEKKDYSNTWMVVGVKKDIVKLKKKVALQPTYYKMRVECVDSFYLGREIDLSLIKKYYK